MFSGILKHNYSLLLFLWLILTALNINKAFHIDDTFHLEAAECIKQNPLKPLTGSINWGDDPTPLSQSNHPPLLFYLIAFFSFLAGNSEMPLHLFISAFTLMALYYFFKTTQLLPIKNARTLLILFAFCPAFIINQNLMADIPVLALMMGSVYYLFKADSQNKKINYNLAALLSGFGILIKYSLVPILLVLLIVIIIRRDYKNLAALLIPVSILSLWSYWFYTEHGFIHILNRSDSSFDSNQLVAFLACLGSVSAFSISYAYGLFTFKIIKQLVWIALVLFILSLFLFNYNFISEDQYDHYLNYFFMVNGLFISLFIFFQLIARAKADELKKFLLSDSFILFLFIVLISAFIILFAPFIATRHLLLVVPFILLYGHEQISKAGTSINATTISTSVFLGLALGVSDWKYADYYREMASVIDVPKGRTTTWTAGHWGWQWYSKKNGMKQYDMNFSTVKEGDYLIYPGDVSKQKINKNIRLTFIGKKYKDADMLTFFSGNNFASLYNSSVYKAPWTLSKTPIDTIFIYRIELPKIDTAAKTE